MLYLCDNVWFWTETQIYNNMFYLLESTAERRARRNNDIKHLFQHLTINEGMSFMDAYEAVGYHFYLSAGQIRDILAHRK